MHDVRVHNTAMTYAHAYPSDPFAYIRMRRDLELGIYDREQVISHAEAVIAERKAAVEKKFKDWKQSELRAAQRTYGRAA